MNSIRAELRRLRWPLLALGLSLLLAIGLGIWARQFTHKAAAKVATAERQAAHLRAEAQRLQREEQDMRGKISAYQALAARNVIGPEKRLDWVELIRSIEHERQLLDVEYEFRPQTSLAGMGSGNSGYTFMNSAMRVKLALLHEEDLLRFISDLKTLAPAIIRVRSCRIARSTAASLPAGNTGMPPQLQAECAIDWITLNGNGTTRR